MLSVLLGILTALIVSAIEVWLQERVDFSLVHFSILFIVPVGAIFFGILSSSGICIALKIRERKVLLAHLFLAATVAVLSFFLAYYRLYSDTFVGRDLGINYFGSGEHISNYSLSGGGRIDFIRYLELSIESQQWSIAVKVGGPIKVFEGIKAPSELNYLEFGISGLGTVLGSLIFLIWLFTERYCDKCQLYAKKIVLCELNPSEYRVHGYEILEAVSGEDPELFLTRVATYQNTNHEGDKYLDFALTYCPSCFKSTVQFRVHRRKTNRGFALQSSSDILVSNDFARSLVVTLNKTTHSLPASA